MSRKHPRESTQLPLFAQGDDSAQEQVGSPNLSEEERAILAVALALGATEVPAVSPLEWQLLNGIQPATTTEVSRYRRRILDRQDPLGDAFCAMRSAEVRRKSGATYTPQAIVDAMVAWAAEQAVPQRVVEPGAGSARYLMASGRRFRSAALVGIELDPIAALLARANLATAGFARRARIMRADYREFPLDPIQGRTLFIGNPPYVRHHLVGAAWKQWLLDKAESRGIAASALAGLHAHFFLATALKAAPRDLGAFITSAEWLDVNYGRLVRDLFLDHLGGRRIIVVEPTARPFPDAATTAAITYFEVGTRPTSVKLKRIESVDELREPNGNRVVRRERLETEHRWSQLMRPAREGPDGFVELGEMFRVHRGQVTGANRVWIAGPHSQDLPESVLFPTVTKAVELFRAGRVLDDPSELRRVIDLPVDLDVFTSPERRVIARFLNAAKKLGTHLGYVAANRKAWWSVGLRQPAPILATYMARRPPAFVRNRAAARHINIAHGLYPRESFSERVLSGLIDYLTRGIRLADGRTYAGGLVKFEPREMERLMVPSPEMLGEGAN